MTVNEAVLNIQNELKYHAKVDIIEKYNAQDSDIGEDGFTYLKDGDVEFRHPFSAISPEMVHSVLHREMIYICYQTVPLTLLESKDSSASIIRQVDQNWNIRQPNYPTSGEVLDIDDSLAQIVIYRSLSTFGISAYSQTAKELLNAYKDSLVIPTPATSAADIDFRFSTDGSSWHDTYQDGDKFFSIQRSGVWGQPIPIGGGGGGGASSFVELSDTPETLSANKILKVNSYGTAIEFGDLPATPSFLSLSDTPSAYVGGKFLAVNQSGNAISFVDAPSGGSSGGSDIVYGYPATMPYDLRRDSTKQFMMLYSDTQFSVAVDEDGISPKMDTGVIYTIEVFPNGNIFSFHQSPAGMPMRIPSNIPTIDENTYAILFNIMFDGDDIFIFNVNVY